MTLYKDSGFGVPTQELTVAEVEKEEEKRIKEKFASVHVLLSQMEKSKYDEEFRMELLHWLTLVSMDTLTGKQNQLIPAPLEGYVSLLDHLLTMQLYTEARLVIKKIRKMTRKRNPERLTIEGLIVGNAEKAREIVANSGKMAKRAEKFIRRIDPKNSQQALEEIPDLKNNSLGDEELLLRFATKQLATKLRFFGSDEYRALYLQRLQEGFLSENEFIAVCSILIDKSATMRTTEKNKFKEFMSKLFAFNDQPEDQTRIISEEKMLFCKLMMDLTGFNSIALPLPTISYESQIN